MNICYIHSADFTEHKGSSIHVKELVKHLSQYHHIVLMVDIWDGTPLDTVDIIELKCPESFHLHWRIIKTCITLCRLLISGNIDLLYTKSPLEGAIAGCIGQIFRVPSIYEVNGLIGEEYDIIKAKHILKYGSQILEMIALRKATHLICVTPWIRDILKEKGIEKEMDMDVVQNGADIDVFHPVERAREVLGLDSHRFLVGYTGTLRAWQGLEYLLAAVPLVLEKEPAQFLIVGDGELKQWLLSKIEEMGLQDHISVHDAVDHPDVPTYISACDVCMLLKKPLSSGYSPLKLYEYMACERPVVASRLHGFECLETEKAGILVNPEDPQEIAQAIIMLLRDPHLRKKMGKHGRSFVVSHHSWEKVAQKVSDICRNV